MPLMTHDDANLILRLYELRREEKLRAARAWYLSNFKVKSLEEFDALCPAGSESNTCFRMVTTYWEMAASFVVNGILNPALFIQNSLEFLAVWIRVKPMVAGLRERNNAPHQLRNLEQCADLAMDWLSQQGSGVYESFEARFRP
jgi:hypothetical protein